MSLPCAAVAPELWQRVVLWALLLPALAWARTLAQTPGAASGGSSALVRTGKDFVDAFRNPNITTVSILSDIYLEDAELPPVGQEIAVRRDLLVTGESAAAPLPVISMNLGGRAFMRLAHRVTLTARGVLWTQNRRGLGTMSPGLDMLAPLRPNETALVVVQRCVLMHAVCMPRPAQVALLSNSSLRPALLPGPQKVGVVLPQAGCVNSTSAPLLSRCWPRRGLYEDLALPGMDANETGALRPTGYLLHVMDTQFICEVVMTEACIQNLGPTGCFLFLMPPRTVPAAASAAPAPGTGAGAGAGAGAGEQQTAAADGGGGSGGTSTGTILAIVLPCVLGGLLLLGLIVAAALWRQRRNQRQLQQKQKQQTQPRDKRPEPSSPVLGKMSAAGANTTQAAAAAVAGYACASSSQDQEAHGGGADLSAAAPAAAAAAAATPPPPTALAALTADGGGGTVTVTAAAGAVAAPPSNWLAIEALLRRVSAQSGNAAAAAAGAAAVSSSAATTATSGGAASGRVGLHSAASAAAPSGGSSSGVATTAAQGGSRGATGGAVGGEVASDELKSLGVMAAAAAAAAPPPPPAVAVAALAANPPPPSVVVTPFTPHRSGLKLDLQTDAEVELLPVVRGQGNFGRVVEGLWAGRPVAVKLMPDVAAWSGAPKNAMQSFVQEVEVLGRVEHPCIVQLLAACVTPPRLCLVMELMETSLDKVIHNPDKQLVPLEKVLHIGIEVARALEYLHPTIVHRDLPGNVLLNHPESPRPVVKLTDFGLSRLRSTVQVTRHPEAGTPAYMAPELYDIHNNVVTDKSDVYSLGVLLWELLSGLAPWHGCEALVVAYAITIQRTRLSLAAISADRLPQKLHRLISACWEHDPLRRPAAAEIHKQLLLVLQDLQRQQQQQQQQHGGGGAVAAVAAGAGSAGAGAAGPPPKWPAAALWVPSKTAAAAATAPDASHAPLPTSEVRIDLGL
ncbi:hypothetical protein HXX76_012482 [Chlamydomonas incerta]|uniref:Protein kinase domain-containing protein n=1 Tax=Chlamydomonas incerta TaxID=51695 RepID=A0A835VW35_CHLIN|nr:hypothetical protein HXX76_012482 [Chlamydomonas incerta]|eukprot:KAG2427286.1 hypothetical protein HXX76_012482 [Chlamydomonas incerta]